MIDEPLTLALVAILCVVIVSWLLSIALNDVSFVDSLWPLLFLVAAVVFALNFELLSMKGCLVLVLVAVWALRLSIYITARNWGQPEDYRYKAIRKKNEPGFKFKSLYLVFVLQGLLAWLVAMPLLPAIGGQAPLDIVDLIALALWTIGILFESVGDYQLSKFKARVGQEGRVLDAGLWRYTRHPNYFGDFCVWWSFFLFALTSGGWWTIASPIVMSILLLKVSGVAMLEATIQKRRPKYADYIRQTNAFFPGPRRGAGQSTRSTT